MRHRKRKYKPVVIRPWSLGPCPTAAGLAEAWEGRHASQAAFIRLLSVLGELTAYTDCNLEHLGGFGKIAGRRGGLKAWLAREAPGLNPYYKSISRHATLATELKKALNYFPPAPLSLLHPDLPVPSSALPFIRHFAANLREKYFRDVAPTYVAFKALADEILRANKKRHRWGPALPREQWAGAEAHWRKTYVLPQARKSIAADFDLFARDYLPVAKCSWNPL